MKNGVVVVILVVVVVKAADSFNGNIWESINLKKVTILWTLSVERGLNPIP